MAKKSYGHNQGGEYGEEIKVVRLPSKKKHQGYDYIDPQAGRIAKGAAKGIGNIIKGVARKVNGYLDEH